MKTMLSIQSSLFLLPISFALLQRGPCPEMPHSNLSPRHGVSEFKVKFMIPFSVTMESNIFKRDLTFCHSTLSATRFKMEDRGRNFSQFDVELHKNENGGFNTILFNKEDEYGRFFNKPHLHIWIYSNKGALVWSCLETMLANGSVNNDVGVIVMIAGNRESFARAAMKKLSDAELLVNFDETINSTQFCQGVVDRHKERQWYYILIFLPLILILLSIARDFVDNIKFCCPMRKVGMF